MSPTLIRSLRGQLCVMALSALISRHGAQQELATAVACPPAAALDDTWQPRDLGSFHLRLPPGFEQGKRLECEHGGVYFARDTERVGWCMIMFGNSETSGADTEHSLSFLGAPARLACSRDARGNWSIYISPLSHSSVFMIAYGRARTEATAAQLITSLLAAERPR